MDNELIYEEYDENGNIIPCIYHSGVRQCKLCEILLSKARECHKLRHKDDHNEWITIKYGDYYDEAPDYCKECYNRFVKGKEKINKRKQQGGYYRTKIKQLTFAGDVVKIWESISEASRELNIAYTGVRNCTNKITKTFAGFKWEKLK